MGHVFFSYRLCNLSDFVLCNVRKCTSLMSESQMYMHQPNNKCYSLCPQTGNEETWMV